MRQKKNQINRFSRFERGQRCKDSDHIETLPRSHNGDDQPKQLGTFVSSTISFEVGDR